MSKRIILPLTCAVLAIFCLCMAIAILSSPEAADLPPTATVYVDSELVAGELRSYGELLAVDKDTVQSQLGAGTPQYDDNNQLTKLAYGTTLFGIMAELTLSLADDAVTAVNVRFIGAVGDDVMDLASLELGDAVEVSRVGSDLDALWLVETTEYRLTQRDGDLRLTIQRTPTKRE